MNNQVQEGTSRFSRGAWLVLGFASLLLLLGIAQLIYRYTLPTDGWSTYTEEIVESIQLFDSNLVGAPSDLQTADALLAVDGIPLVGTASSYYVPAPANWQVGRTVLMLVRRGDEQLEVTVPVVNWTMAALFTYNLRNLSQFAAIIGGLIMLIVGWFTFWQRPEVPSARALLILSTTVGVNVCSGLIPTGLSVQFNQTAFVFTAFYSFIIFGVLLAPSLLAFTLLFPKPKKIIQRHPWVALLPFVYGGLLLLFFIAGGPGEAGWFSTLAMFFLSIISLIHSGFTQRDTVSRAQLRWAVSSFVLGLGLFMLTFPVAFNWVTVTNPLMLNLLLVIPNLGFMVIGIGLAIAVLRYRLYDIDVIIRKTLVYAVLTGLLLLIYFGMVVLLQSLFESISGQQSPIAIVISTLGIAALFAPLRRRVQDLIDRRFFRKKYDAQQVLAQFGQVARDETDIEELSVELLQVVQETMQPESVALWLKSGRGR